MNLREPMHPVIKNALIMLTSGIVASAVCAKVYGATLPLEEPTGPAVAIAASQPAPTANDDAKAAAALRALLKGQPPLVGTPNDGAPRQ